MFILRRTIGTIVVVAALLLLTEVFGTVLFCHPLSALTESAPQACESLQRLTDVRLRFLG